jgi:hypothetical protein
LLKVIGNIIAYNPEFSNELLKERKFDDIISKIILNNKNIFLKKEALWIVSNVFASNNKEGVQ